MRISDWSSDVCSSDLALSRLRHQAYSGLVLDIMLPGMNGFDVLRAVRADKTLATLPVIVLTAKGQADDRRTAEAIGATARSEEHTSELQSLMRISYAVFCLKKKTTNTQK